MNLIDKIDRYLSEGKKTYHMHYGVGTSKYDVSYHDGKSKNKDGSNFFALKIFKSKKKLAEFLTKLGKDGYTETIGLP